MTFRFAVFIVATGLVASSIAYAQTQVSDSQALAYASQSIAAMTAGSSINDITMAGNVTWNGSDTGTVTLRAMGTGESRIDLVLASGTRTEIRDASTGLPLGKWIAQDGTSGFYALQNCWADAAWFFAPLGSLAVGPNVILSYVGQENRNSLTVQHIVSKINQSGQELSLGIDAVQLSTMDFYLDASTLLPVALTYTDHPDDDANTGIPVEVDFSEYQSINGVTIPTRIQRYLQRTLVLEVAVTGVSANTGLSVTDFNVD